MKMFQLYDTLCYIDYNHNSRVIRGIPKVELVDLGSDGLNIGDRHVELVDLDSDGRLNWWI